MYTKLVRGKRTCVAVEWVQPLDYFIQVLDECGFIEEGESLVFVHKTDKRLSISISHNDLGMTFVVKAGKVSSTISYAQGEPTKDFGEDLLEVIRVAWRARNERGL